MLRGSVRIPGLSALLACLLLPAATAGADPIPIDDFSGPLATRTSLAANGLGQILPFPSTGELDYLGDLLGMQIGYTGLGDLTQMSNDALALDIRSLVPSAGPLNLAVSVNGGASTLSVPITATGTLLLPYADFSDPSSFTSVDALLLTFTAGTSFAFAADDLRAVPEPRTAVMVGLGLLGLAISGRRERRAARALQRPGSRPRAP